MELDFQIGDKVLFHTTAGDRAAFIAGIDPADKNILDLTVLIPKNTPVSADSCSKGAKPGQWEPFPYAHVISGEDFNEPTEEPASAPETP